MPCASAQPLVSVVVPVYNTAAYLPACLDSLAAQTYTRMEILCVNDGSTDHSLDILRTYAEKDARIRIIDQPNAGLAAARNAALDAATGEYIAGLDSDDCWEPTLLEQVVQVLEPGADMVVFGAQYLLADGTKQYVKHFSALPAGAADMSPELAAAIPVAFWNKLWRRAFLEEHALRMPTGLLNEDEPFCCLACLHARRVCFAATDGYLYRVRGDSIMGAAKKKTQSLHHIRNAEFAYERFLALPAPSAAQRRLFIHWLGNLLESGVRGANEAEYAEIRTRAQAIARALSDGAPDFILDNLLHLPARRGGGLFRSCTVTCRYRRVFGIPLYHVRMRRGHLRVSLF